MKVIPIPALKDNYIWLLVDASQKTAVCVDPGEASPLLLYLKENKLTLVGVLLTHHHYDHINGIEELLEKQPHLPVYGPNDARITSPVLSDNPLFFIDNWQFRVLQTPGHTSTHICFYEVNQKLLFCGDTLFSAGCGRVFDGSLELLHDTLYKLRELPDDTKVYCGHEYTRHNLQYAATVEPLNSAIDKHYNYLMQHPTLCSLPSTIGLEKEINPFFRLRESAVKEYGLRRGVEGDDDFLLFKQLREDKDNF